MRLVLQLPRLLLFLTFVFMVSCLDTDPANSKDASKSRYVASGVDGAMVFAQNCKVCHGSDGRLGLNGAKDLSASTLSIPERVEIITHGKKMMTPFGKVLSAAEIDSVAAFTLRFKQSTPQ